MTRTTITLPEPTRRTEVGNLPLWRDDAELTWWVRTCDNPGAVLAHIRGELTPAEARAFGAALIAASYQAEQPTTLGDKGV